MAPTPNDGLAVSFYGSSTGHGDGLMDVYCGFALSPMVAGETFSFDMDNEFIVAWPHGSPPGAPFSVGFTLDVAVGVGAPVLFQFGFVGGEATYSYLDARA